MKRYLIILLLPVVSLFFSACSDDDELSSTSVVREATTEENDFDRWLTRNYVEPYNILFKYRFEDIESSMDYYLTPASYEQSVAMAKLVLHMCLEAYNEITGDTEFIKAYFPKILYLVGSYAYKTNGSLVLGTAEAGPRSRCTTSMGWCPRPSMRRPPISRRSTMSSDTSSIRRSPIRPILQRSPDRTMCRTSASRSIRPMRWHSRTDSFRPMPRKQTARISSS